MTIIFPDHAIGRLIERSRDADPISTMIEAHRTMLRARVADLGRTSMNARIPATVYAWAFLCSALTGDVTGYGAFLMPCPNVADRDQLRDDQRRSCFCQ